MKIIKNNKPLEKEKYTLEINGFKEIFGSKEDGIKIECFNNCKIVCESNCKIDCDYDCKIICGSNCNIVCWNNCEIKSNEETKVKCWFEGNLYDYEFKKTETIKFKDGKFEVIE